MAKKQKKRTKEQVYDSEIFPLMEQIIAICHREKIAVVASFSIPSDEDDGLACTTTLLEDSHDPPDEFLKAARILRGHKSLTMVNVRDGDGKITQSTAILDG